MDGLVRNADGMPALNAAILDTIPLDARTCTVYCGAARSSHVLFVKLKIGASNVRFVRQLTAASAQTISMTESNARIGMQPN